MHFFSIIDDYSIKDWIYFLKTRNEAFKRFKEWKILVKNQTNKSVKAFKNDDGLGLFYVFCKSCEILRHKTVKHTPQQNRRVEGINRTLLNKVKCMLLSSGLLIL